MAKHISSRVYLNEKELVEALTKFVFSTQKDSRLDSVPVQLTVQDFASVSYEQQAALIGNSSIIIGMHGN